MVPPNNNKSTRLFDRIAPVYDLFYGYQKWHYGSVLDRLQGELDLTLYENVIDVGCGTGALCSVLNQKGLKVTGIDQSEKMLGRGRARLENRAVNFLAANVLDGLPFADETFDVSIASFVAHGLKAEERKILYLEMKRISTHLVILYDYNQRRSIPTSVIEWLEGGDYFNFIKYAVSEMGECFPDVKAIDAGARTKLYVCNVAAGIGDP